MHVHTAAVDAGAGANVDLDVHADLDVNMDMDVGVDVDLDKGRLACENTVAAWTCPRMRRHILDGRWKIYCHYREDQNHRRIARPPEPPISMLAMILRA